jgi:hypothetical protein
MRMLAIGLARTAEFGQLTASRNLLYALYLKAESEKATL